MAQDSDVTKPADKGKGKAVDTEKVEDAKKGKDGQVNGKKDHDKIIDSKAHRILENYKPALFTDL